VVIGFSRSTGLASSRNVRPRVVNTPPVMNTKRAPSAGALPTAVR
jgi:hypothetical protein